MVPVKINLLRKTAVKPKRQTPGAIGYDLTVPEDTIIKDRRHLIKLGFALELPEYIEAKVEPRSGFSVNGIEAVPVQFQNKPIRPVPGAVEVEGTWVQFGQKARFDADVIPGKVDPDYRGEVGVILRNNDLGKPFLIPAGTRIAQLTFYLTERADFKISLNMSPTERGAGGFGHTGSSNCNDAKAEAEANLLYKLRRHGLTADTKQRVIFVPYEDDPWRFPQTRRLVDEFHFNIQLIIT